MAVAPLPGTTPDPVTKQAPLCRQLKHRLFAQRQFVVTGVTKQAPLCRGLKLFLLHETT